MAIWQPCHRNHILFCAVINSKILKYGKLFKQTKYNTLEYNDKHGYIIKNSRTTRDKLFKFFNNYGKKGIKINIGF